MLQALVYGYADRPALGQRTRELVTDPTTGRTSTRLLPSFETVSYRELWIVSARSRPHCGTMPPSPRRRL